MKKGAERKKILFLATVLLMIVFTASMVFSEGAPVNIGDTAKTTTALNFREAAGMTGKIAKVLVRNTEVTVLNKVGGWYQVKLSDGKVGYVYAKYLMLAQAAAKAENQPAVQPAAEPVFKAEPTMVLATTTSTRDTGLLDVLMPAFDKKYGVTTKVVSVGTGEAIEMGKRGDADVILVHARKSEDEFVASGFGVNRKDVMYNFFFLVGPKDDPVGVADLKTVQEAMAKVASSKAKFVSRGDQSGTHKKELAIWSTYGIKPQGEAWYMESGQGMGDTLMMAGEMGAYTLVDSGTWFAFQDKVNLKVVLQGDPILFNPYGVIAVNPEKYPNIHHNAANAFIYFITSDEGQKMIADYKKNGQQLFMPDAK